MKRETNNEIDLLLRRMSRRDGSSARDREAQNADTHLDADELSSYAQNVLPATARARYTEHLAECSTCRKLVTELSLSLGATAAVQPSETVFEPSGLKKFLAGLFSPMVLRYAVPALGVIVVMVVGFVVLRREKPSDRFVAQVGVEQKQPVPVSPGAPAPTPSVSEAEGFLDAPQEKAANTRKPATRADESGSASGTAATDAISPAAPVVAQREEKAAEPAPSATPPPPAAAKAEAAEEEAQKKTATIAKNQGAPTVGAVTVDTSKGRSNEAGRDFRRAQRVTASADSADQNKPKAAPAETQSLAGATALKRGRGDSDKDASDTRSVAGRRFRKERGIWTDTAYDSSTATVNVARGSEQFRALVADEPGMKTIAEQLDGEVIVVWKGRAYRIR